MQLLVLPRKKINRSLPKKMNSMTWTEYLKEHRTLTEEEVARRTAEHDAEEFQFAPEPELPPKKDHELVLSG